MEIAIHIDTSLFGPVELGRVRSFTGILLIFLVAFFGVYTAQATLLGSPANAQTPTPTPRLDLPSGGYVLLPSSEVTAGSKKDDALGTILAFVSSIAWPVVILIVALSLANMPEFRDFLKRVFRQSTQLTIANFQIQMNEKASATLEDLGKLLEEVPKTHEKWLSCSNLQRQFEYVVLDIKHYLTSKIGNQLSKEDVGKFRFTLYVRDVILAHSVRQLVNYLGNGRGGKGRIFSERYGIIGKAWRSERSQKANEPYSADDLIEKWGMTSAETNDTTGGKTIFLAVCIKNTRGLVGVLYADSTESQLFERNAPKTINEVFEDFEAKVNEFSAQRGLTEALSKLEEARTSVEQFDPYARN